MSQEETQNRLYQRRDDAVKTFEESHIFSEGQTPRENIHIRNYKDGSKFTGEVQDDKRHGKGAYHFGNGDKYIGNWENDQMNGHGHYIYANGE